MPHDRPLDLLLLGPPSARGADALLARVGARGGALRVMLTGAGLAWTADPRLAGLARDRGAHVALCSRSARDRGVDPEGIPPWVRWSSLATWMATAPRQVDLWGLVP